MTRRDGLCTKCPTPPFEHLSQVFENHTAKFVGSVLKGNPDAMLEV